MFINQQIGAFWEVSDSFRVSRAKAWCWFEIGLNPVIDSVKRKLWKDFCLMFIGA